MNDVSLLRLYVLRALYLLIVIGLAFNVWPAMIEQTRPWELMDGVVRCMLAAFSLVCLVGVRYPLQCLPILFWEMIWKLLWLGIVGYPAWRDGQMDAAIRANAFACSMVVLCLVAVPWGYVWEKYARQPGARWRLDRGARGIPSPAWRDAGHSSVNHAALGHPRRIGHRQEVHRSGRQVLHRSCDVNERLLNVDSVRFLKTGRVRKARRQECARRGVDPCANGLTISPQFGDQTEPCVQVGVATDLKQGTHVDVQLP